MATPEEHSLSVKKHKELTPKQHEAYSQWVSSLRDSPIEAKFRELISLGASLALQCEWCIETHSQKAKAFGATEEEISHVIWLAAQVKAGATLSYGAEALLAKTPAPKA